MTPEQLDAIQARTDAATEGPWQPSRGATSDGTEFVRTHEQKAAFLALSLNEGDSELWLVDNGAVIPAATGDGPKAKANSEFIAHARTDVPALLAHARALEARLDLIANQADAAETLCRMNGLDLDLATVPVGAIRAALTATEGQA